MKKTLLLLGSLLGSSAAFSDEVAAISPQEAAAMYNDQNAVIVDVRENEEWNAGHIAGAIHIPLGQIETRKAELEKYKNSALIMQCRSGVRSATAANILKKAGFSTVYNMEGGINAWQKADLKIQQN
jgi:rhodanese-related sulfurtransferase